MHLDKSQRDAAEGESAVGCFLTYLRRVFIIAGLLLLGWPAWCEMRLPVDGFAALVNDKIITVGETLGAMRQLEKQYAQTLEGAELDARLAEAYTNTLESLIERELILDAFRRQQGVVPETAVKSRMEEIERTRFGNNRAELLKALEAEGLTIDEWRESLRQAMIVSFMREREVDRKIVIAPEDVRAAYEAAREKYIKPAQVELRMIAIGRGQTDEEKAVKRRLAEEVRQRLLAGQDFAEVARQVSEGVKAAEGGYWGWVEPRSRRPELAAAIEKLDVGVISELVETEDMFYIIKLDGRRSAAVIPFEEVQDAIRNELRQEQGRRLYESWMARLKRDAFIRRF